jgi:hypothetical protein
MLLGKLRFNHIWSSSPVAGGWVWNSPTTEFAYTYEYAGQTYSAIDSNPFLSESSAEVELERFRRENMRS